MTVAASPNYLHYKLMLRSPAIVSAFAGDPNSVATVPFVPGGAIRGSVAARLLATDSTADSDEFHSLILSGDVRYLHAYPEAQGNRALPMPASWRVDKDNQNTAYDLAKYSSAAEDDEEAADWPEAGLIAPGAQFVSSLASPERVSPRRNARLHQQRDREKGRPWKGSDEVQHGAIFGYEYLEEGQAFRGAIQLMPEAAAYATRIKTLLADPIFIGRSRRAGYGGEAAIEFTHDGALEYADVSGRLDEEVQVGAFFRMMLSSAYVGRHPITGQIDPSALESDIAGCFGEAVTVDRRRTAFTVLGGFNRKWRLELPQALAVDAGSVLVLKAKKSIPVATLRSLEHNGFGERRIEGFGRVVFLKHDGEIDSFRLADQTREPPRAAATPDAKISEDASTQLRVVETRIVLAAARAELNRIALHDITTSGASPTTALLGRLRTLFRSVTTEPTAETALRNLETWCSESDANPHALKESARAKLDGCKVFAITLRKWLRALARPTQEQTRWEALVQASSPSDAVPTPLTGLSERHHLTETEAAQTILEEHAGELSVYLIDAVLVALARGNGGRR